MYGVFTLSFAGELPCFRSYTICMYVSGQPYLNLPLQKCNNAGPAAQQDRIGGQGLGTEARPLSSVLEKIRANKQKLAEK